MRNCIGISRNFSAAAKDLIDQPALARVGVGVGGQVNYFTNAFDTRTRGVGVVGSWRGDLGPGGLNLTLAYNYNLSTMPRFDPVIISVDQIQNFRRLAPNHCGNFSANWQSDGFGITVRESFYGSWQAQTDYPHQVFGSKFTTDVDVSSTFAEHYTFSVGAINLFNTFPDRIANSPSNTIFTSTNSLADGQIYPSNGGPFGINGGFWYGRVRVKF